MMNRLIKSLDFLSPSPKLRIYSEERYKTFLGGIFSLLTSIAISILSGYFIISTFSRDQISVMYNELHHSFPTYDFFSKPHLITITDRNGFPIPDQEKLFEIRSLYSYLDTKTLTIKQVSPKIDIGCKYKQYWPDWSEFLFFSNRTFSCINPKESQIEGKKIFNIYGDVINGFSYLGFFLNKCLNNTSLNKTNCFPKEKIDDILSSIFINFFVIDYQIDNYNQTSPGIPYLKNIIMPVSNTIFKRFILKYRNVEYNTDNGYVFEDKVSDKFNKLEPWTESVDLRQTSVFPGNFAVVTFQSSEIKQIHNRNYVKLQELLANIGGVMKGVMLIALLIENYFADTLFIIKLANDFVYFNSDEFNISRKKKFNYSNDISSINERKKIELQSVNTVNNNYFKRPSFIHLKNEKSKSKFKASTCDFICSKLYQTKNIKILDVVSEYINKKTSIDHIMKKMNELDITRFILMKENELHATRLIDVPSITLLDKKDIDDKIQYLWSQFEFDDGIEKLEVEKLEEELQKDNNTPVGSKILELLNCKK